MIARSIHVFWEKNKERNWSSFPTNQTNFIKTVKFHQNRIRKIRNRAPELLVRFREIKNRAPELLGRFREIKNGAPELLGRFREIKNRAPELLRCIREIRN